MKKFIHIIFIFSILVFYLYGCNDTEVYTPTYPLNEKHIIDSVKETGLNWTITSLETESDTDTKTTYSIIFNENKEYSFLKGAIFSGTKDNERILDMFFSGYSSNIHHVLEPDWKPVITFSTLLFGGFESKDIVYEYFINDFNDHNPKYIVCGEAARGEWIIWEREINGFLCSMRLSQQYFKNEEDLSNRQEWVLMSILITSNYETFSINLTNPNISITEINNETDNKLFIKDEMYEFPITHNDSLWKSFNSTQERINVSKVPEDIAKSMTTNALIETVIAHPMFPISAGYNTKSQKINALIDFFDYSGLSELLLRDDTATILIDLYTKIDVQKAENDFDEWQRMFIIEYLLGNRTIWGSIKSDTDMELLAETVVNKYLDKSNSDSFSDFTKSSFFHTLDMSNNEMEMYLNLEQLNISINVFGNDSVLSNYSNFIENNLIDIQINIDDVLTLENSERIGNGYKYNSENFISDERASDMRANDAFNVE